MHVHDPNGLVGRSPQVVVVDDHPLAASAVVDVLRRAGMTAHSLDPATVDGVGELFDRDGWDLAVVDNQLEDRFVVHALPGLMMRRPDAKVVILTAHDTPTQVLAAVDAGATGVVSKRAPLDQLVAAVTGALAGMPAFDPHTWQVVRARASTRRRPGSPSDRLSPRELLVLRRVSEGASNKQIAREIGVSTGTVKTYLARAATKLGVSGSRAALAAAAVRHQAV